jgi:hypothetical protein
MEAGVKERELTVEQVGLVSDLLRYAIQLVGRIAIPVEKVHEAVGNARKQIEAFNLADGINSQQHIARKLRINSGNFSRTSGLWVEKGVAFWLGQGKEKRLCHIYPLPYPSKLPSKRRRRWSGRGKLGKRS